MPETSRMRNAQASLTAQSPRGSDALQPPLGGRAARSRRRRPASATRRSRGRRWRRSAGRRPACARSSRGRSGTCRGPGGTRNEAIAYSSNEIVNAIRYDERIAGRISGSVTRTKAVISPAPRSRAASAIAGSSVWSRGQDHEHAVRHRDDDVDEEDGAQRLVEPERLQEHEHADAEDDVGHDERQHHERRHGRPGEHARRRQRQRREDAEQRRERRRSARRWRRSA